MSALRHQDYQGDVEFDDGRLIIRILHIDDFITTEVDSASEAQSAFAALVDDYIASCKEVGKEPCKPFKGSFNVRMNPKLHKQVAMAAADEGETLNAFVVAAIENRLQQEEVDYISHAVVEAMASYLMQPKEHRDVAVWDVSSHHLHAYPIKAHGGVALYGPVDTAGFTELLETQLTYGRSVRPQVGHKWIVKGRP